MWNRLLIARAWDLFLPPKQRRFWFQPKVKLPGTEFPAWELQSASKGKAAWLQEQMVRVRPPRSALWLPALTPCPGHTDVGARVCTLLEKGPGWVWGREPSGRQLWYTETQGRTHRRTQKHTPLFSLGPTASHPDLVSGRKKENHPNLASWHVADFESYTFTTRRKGFSCLFLGFLWIEINPVPLRIRSGEFHIS